MISIRIANLVDVPAIAKLFNQYRIFYNLPDSPSLCQSYIQDRLANDESMVFLAEISEQTVGFCQIYPTFCSLAAQKIFALYDLYVDPIHRRKGIARALLLAVEESARKNNIARLDLTTAKTNRQAQKLYESLGWIKDEIYFAYNRQISTPSER